MVNDQSSKKYFAPRKHSTTKEIWSLGHRPKYYNRLKIAAFGDPKGPYSLVDISGQRIPFIDRAADWNSVYMDELRQLALSYWVGSEFDIAVLRKEPGHEIQRPLTRIFHEFNALTNKGLQMLHGFSWVERMNCHIAAGNLDYIEIIPYLLSYYHAVFFDDLISKKSRVYFHREVALSLPSKIKIRRGNSAPIRYLRDEEQRHLLNVHPRSNLVNSLSY